MISVSESAASPAASRKILAAKTIFETSKSRRPNLVRLRIGVCYTACETFFSGLIRKTGAAEIAPPWLRRVCIRYRWFLQSAFLSAPLGRFLRASLCASPLWGLSLLRLILKALCQSYLLLQGAFSGTLANSCGRQSAHFPCLLAYWYRCERPLRFSLRFGSDCSSAGEARRPLSLPPSLQGAGYRPSEPSVAYGPVPGRTRK